MRVLSSELVERVADAIAIILVVWFALRGLMLTHALRLALAVLEVGVGLAVVFGILLMARNANMRQRLDAWNPVSKASRLAKWRHRGDRCGRPADHTNPGRNTVRRSGRNDCQRRVALVPLARLPPIPLARLTRPPFSPLS